MKRLFTQFIKNATVPLGAIALWQVIAVQAKNPFFPDPITIIKSMKSVYTPQWISQSLLTSLYTVLAGFFIGALLGLVLGSLIGGTAWLRQIFIPITNFIRSIPSAAKAPLIFSLFGIGLSSRVATVAIAVLFPVLLTTLRAVATTDQSLLDYATLLRFNYFTTLIRVRIPAATGEILAGMQVAMQIAVLVLVVSEMLGSGRGVGAFVIRAQSTYMLTDMWVGILTLGVMGTVLIAGLHVLERTLAPWYFWSKEVR